MSKSTDIVSHNDDDSKPITIVLADDHPILRTALKNILEKQPNFKVLAEASDGEEAIKLAAKLMPNVIIMDIGMPKINGIEATRQIKQKFPQIAVLVLTVYDDMEHGFGILQAGASGYLTKGVFDHEIIHAINSVVDGETVLSPSISKEIIRYALRYMVKPVKLTGTDKLSNKEIEIIRLAANGQSNQEIAQKLSLSIRTVKNYLAQIFLKLGVNSRTEAVITCLREDIFTIDDLK